MVRQRCHIPLEDFHLNSVMYSVCCNLVWIVPSQNALPDIIRYGMMRTCITELCKTVTYVGSEKGIGPLHKTCLSSAQAHASPHSEGRRRRRYRVASEGHSVAPRWPRVVARLHRSAGGIPLSFRTWSIHRSRGRPGRRFYWSSLPWF